MDSALHTPSRQDRLSNIPTLDEILRSRPDRLSPRKLSHTLHIKTPTDVSKRISFLTSKPSKSGARPSLLKSPGTWTDAACEPTISESPLARSTAPPNAGSWREVGLFVEDSDDCASELSGASDASIPKRSPPPPRTSSRDLYSVDSATLLVDSLENVATSNSGFGLLRFNKPTPKTPKTPSPKSSTGPAEGDDLFSPRSARRAGRQLSAEGTTPLGDRSRPIELLSSDEEASPSKNSAPEFPSGNPKGNILRHSFGLEEPFDDNEGVLVFEPARNPVKRKAKPISQPGCPRVLVGSPSRSPNRPPPNKYMREKQQAASDYSDDAEVFVLSSSDESSYSPVKPRTLPRTPSRTRPTTLQTPTTTPKRTPGRNNKSKQAALAHLAEETVVVLNSKVFENKIPQDLKLVWSKRLNTTAGRANWKRIRKEPGDDEHECSIDLSTKVLDNEERVLNTVAHELCHLAAWIIDGQIQPAHGRSFKAWAKKVMKFRPDIEITTRHDYEIAYKYEWRCANPVCARTYGRHTKSIDPTQHACGICKGKLEPMFQTCSPTKRNAFQDYLKIHMKDLKTKNPSMSHAELMKELSKCFKDEKARQTTTEIPEMVEMDDGNLIEKMKAMRLG